MADTGSSIFNKQAVERLRSPDDLDRYLRVTSPRMWVALLAVIVLALGILAWGVFGTVSSSVTSTGANVDGQLICLLDAEQAARVHEGDSAYVAGRQATVASVSATPLSRNEVRQIVPGDYLAQALMSSDWAFLITFDGAEDVEEDVPLQVSITTERVAPIRLVLG